MVAKKTGLAKKKSSRSRAVAVTVPTLTLATPSKKKAKGSDKLVVDGMESFVTAMRTREQEIESLSALQDQDKVTLVQHVRVKRLDAEKAGSFFKSCLVTAEGEDEKPGMVTFKDAFSKVGIENEDALRGAFGDHYDALVDRHEDISLRDGTRLEELEEALGEEAFEKLKGFIDVTEYLKFAKGFMERRATLRPSIADAANTVLDQLVEQVQHKPSVKLK